MEVFSLTLKDGSIANDCFAEGGNATSSKGANYIPKKRAYSPESDISGSPKRGHL